MLYSPLFCKYLVTASLCLWVVACSSALYIPTAETTSSSEELADLTEGRKLYIAHCGSCHNLYTPQSYTREKWIVQVDEMKKEAHISDGQADLILQYVTGYQAPLK